VFTLKVRLAPIGAVPINVWAVAGSAALNVMAIVSSRRRRTVVPCLKISRLGVLDAQAGCDGGYHF
jgi:hypothetical protein